jgi:hypothetical protein
MATFTCTNTYTRLVYNHPLKVTYNINKLICDDRAINYIEIYITHPVLYTIEFIRDGDVWITNCNKFTFSLNEISNFTQIKAAYYNTDDNAFRLLTNYSLELTISYKFCN